MSQQPNNCQDSSTFNRTIRAARQSRGLTQKQLARAAGCSQTTISDIERGYYPAAQQRWIPVLLTVLEQNQ